MEALIIGGAGFVGNYLIQHLIDDLNWSVAVTKMEHETIHAKHKNIEIHNLNILNKSEISALLYTIRPKYIIHLAAQSSVSVAWNNPSLTIDVNIKGSVNVLDAVRELYYKPRVLLIGSGEEYGHIKLDEVPINEDSTLLRPGNIYAATKVCQNMIGKIYSDAYDMDLVMVRAFNHIGPNQAPLFVVADFCKQVASIEKGLSEPVIHVGNLSAKRDFTDVRDVVRAYSDLVQYGKSGETYNVGSGFAIKISDILNLILKQSTANIRIDIDQNKVRPVDVPIIAADISKIKSLTNWQPVIPLEQTIRETLDYWREILNA